MYGELVKQARTAAGLTQTQMAGRLGVTQASVAQLERAGANPRLGTLRRAIAATGQQLELRVVPAAPRVDTSLLREALLMTPAERLRAGDRLLRDAERLAAAARE